MREVERNTQTFRCRVALAFALAAAVCPGRAEPRGVRDGFQPGQPWPDTTGIHINAHGFCILQYEDRYYWYGSYKIPGRQESEKNEAGVSCYVSRDLLNWENAGLVLAKAGRGMHVDVAEAGILDRPKVIYLAATRRFVLYFKLYPPAADGRISTAAGYTGVAVAPQPTGPFKYQGKFLGGGSAAGSGDFAIFQDADGAVYHVCVRKPDQRRKDKPLVCGRLSDDGLKPRGEYVVMDGVENATEAPALFRRAGKIYLLGSGSSGWRPNAARMFVADQMAGPYRPLGNPCRGVNPHNGSAPEVTFGGQSTFVLPVAGRPDAWIAMFDIWQPEDPVNAGYIWLPLEFAADGPVISWRTMWNMSVFENKR